MDLVALKYMLEQLFFTFIFISALLLVGTLLRAKVKAFQKLFLPASVIGGFIGLLLGPIVLKQYALLPIREDWIAIASILPGLLIIPVVASVPLGLKKAQKRIGEKQGSKPIYTFLLILVIIGGLQNLFSLFVAFIFRKTSLPDLYPTFGTEVSAGFTGGHGTAGVVGSLLQSMDQPYWNTAQGVTTTTATVGLIGGLLLGIFLINIVARKGYTEFIQANDRTSLTLNTGILKTEEERTSAGVETTDASSIDSYGFHLALILAVSGLAFVVTALLKAAQIPLLSLIPEWAYAIILMYIVWGMMQKMKLAHLVDSTTKSKIASVFTEFAIVAAIISLPIEALFTYLLPLLIMVFGTLLLTVVTVLYVSKKYFDTYWFEKSMAILGTCTGVFLTGILLLKMVDPKLKSPVLNDYSIAYSMNSVIGFILFPLSFGLLVNSGVGIGIAFYAILLVITIGLLVFSRRKQERTI